MTADDKGIRTRTLPFDPARYLKSPEDMAAYLEAALEEGDPRLVAIALGNIARAKGMTELARETGLTREALYTTLSKAGNPRLTTLLKVVGALGLQLGAHPAPGAWPNSPAHSIDPC